MRNNTASIDLINIGLIFMSLVIAITVPFHLFLFSYIVLGPLHYMTEIGWLSQRNYFIRKGLPKWPLFALGGICACLLVYMNFREALAASNIIPQMSIEQDGNLDNVITSLIFLAFLSTIILIVFKNNLSRLLAFLVVLLLSIFLYNVPWFLVVFGVMIPTLVHTTIFTGAFILQGAMKNKTIISYTSFIVFVLAYFLIFFLPVDPRAGQVSAWVQELYLTGEFFILNFNLFNLFYDSSGSQLILDSEIGIKLQAFIAFAYTYHYLNWFSKTEVIKWHKIPKKWMIATFFVWIISIGLHFIDIKLGIAAIGLISLMHVFLEFPLNHESFISIGKMVLGKK